jgi:multiple sugar transport system substrate-binding protein
MNTFTIRFLSVITIILTLCSLVLITGCAKQGEEQETAAAGTSVGEDTGEVIILWYGGQGKRQFILDAFTKETGIKVKEVSVPWSDLEKKITTAGPSKVGPYDIIELDCIWPGKLAERDFVMDLTDVFPEEMKENLAGPALEQVSYKDRIYGYPWMNSCKYTYYNEKMLKDAGYDAPPRTWQEFAEISRKFVKDNDGDGRKDYAIAWAWKQSETLICDFVILVESFGGSLFDENDNPTFNQAPAVEALAFMVDSIDKKTGYADPSSVTYSGADIPKFFTSRQTPFIMSWENIADDMTHPERGKEILGEGRVMLIPGANDIASATVLGGEGMAIMKNAPNKENAKKFLDFIISLDTQKAIFEELNFLPVRRELYEDEELLAKHPIMKDLGKQIEYGKARPNFPQYTKVSSALQLEIHHALLKKKTPQQAMDDAAENVLNILGK